MGSVYRYEYTVEPPADSSRPISFQQKQAKSRISSSRSSDQYDGDGGKNQ